MKEESYKRLIEQIKCLIEGETDETAVLANVAAAMASAFPNWLWTGFYLVRNGELIVGPFQGPVACFRIQKGKGVCGTAWEKNVTIVVEDVDKYPGHIACSALSRSEIVVPICSKDGVVKGVLDVDSPQLSTFDAVDKDFMEQIVSVISSQLYK